MKPKDYTGIIPPQQTGKNIEAEASVEMEGDKEATIFYNIVKERLLQVNSWHKMAGWISAQFQLMDAGGNPLERAARQGDYIRIDIPGPGSKAGHGYDWAFIEALKEVSFENIQSVGFRVRPAANPNGDSTQVAHFYDPVATSNFIITREGNTITANIIDRNIKPNDDAKSVVDTIRHTVAGVAALGSFSKIQWQNLAEGLLKKD